MPMMMKLISTSVDFTKTQISGYLKNKTFFLQIKKFIIYISRATLWQKNTFVAEVNFISENANIKNEGIAGKFSF